MLSHSGTQVAHHPLCHNEENMLMDSLSTGGPELNRINSLCERERGRERQRGRERGRGGEIDGGGGKCLYVRRRERSHPTVFQLSVFLTFCPNATSELQIRFFILS